MEHEITLGQMISDVLKEIQLILPNSIPEDLGYNSFKGGKKFEMRQIHSITEELQHQCKG